MESQRLKRFFRLPRDPGDFAFLDFLILWGWLPLLLIMVVFLIIRSLL